MTGREDFRSSFFEECEELLEATQDGLDVLADDPHDSDAINGVFRAVHSIKGGAGAFGLDALVAFAHAFESALDGVRSGALDLDDGLVDLFRHCGDNLSDLVSAAREGASDDIEASAHLKERLREVTVDHVEDAPDPQFEPVTLLIDAGGHDETLSRWDMEFTANPDLFASGNEPGVLFAALERFGEVSVVADIQAVPPLTDLSPLSCTISWQIALFGQATEEDLRQAFEFVEDVCELRISKSGDVIDQLVQPSNVQPGSLPEDSATDALMPDLQDFVAELSDGDAATDAALAPVSSDEDKKTAPPARATSTIRVDLERIDKLINLVGELVIKEAMLTQTMATLDIARMSEVSSALDSVKQIAGEIQEGVMAIRAQPVKPMFQRMARIVREASAATGKPVRFVTIGDTTEVDKTVIERLVDPLTHMIRNAIDHGLETPEERVAAGKTEEGTITLSAAHKSGRVLIDVVDDGGGINRDAVRALAVKRGLVAEQDSLTPAEIDNLLFMPGFSSKEEVSELSGRGVGLDVVRSEIQKLGGRVAIQSDPGEGATFSISLPLTLAVLEGMVVDVSGETMVVPISAVQETVRPTGADLHQLGIDGVLLRNRDEMVPVIDLGAFFGFRCPPQQLEDHVLLLMSNDQGPRYALVVDDIQDQRQVVIKSLETNYQQINGVAAATILGDGRIALIIDADTIMRALSAGGQLDAALDKTFRRAG